MIVSEPLSTFLHPICCHRKCRVIKQLCPLALNYVWPIGAPIGGCGREGWRCGITAPGPSLQDCLRLGGTSAKDHITAQCCHNFKGQCFQKSLASLKCGDGNSSAVMSPEYASVPVVSLHLALTFQDLLIWECHLWPQPRILTDSMIMIYKIWCLSL